MLPLATPLIELENVTKDGKLRYELISGITLDAVTQPCKPKDGWSGSHSPNGIDVDMTFPIRQEAVYVESWGTARGLYRRLRLRFLRLVEGHFQIGAF